MKTNAINFKFLIGLFAISLVFSCSNDDDNNDVQLEQWEIEIEQARTATTNYADINVATGEGRFDASGYIPNMGHHYLNPALADGTFNLLQPEFILYAPDENDVMQMVAIEYGIVPEDPENPGSPPEGFTGSEDVWHFNEMIGMWTLHVWTVMENPDGIFTPMNPDLD
ncbi:MAG: hypothetical protein KJO41_07770 [Bacteroidia bacterium]|nr:hypothetical protein [Bacteroidia bacterium]NND24636.1 hypothetical protein [Flavobacteriaceae bacterium]MBT8278884.1 hypothetical protein [Bacteroidia bacterium]NNK59629.1 hypothetical protein [Flavobacteriaceae bacterium]NNL34052.1 hypothetical protein [Flavobacteriaceae bacterium]